MTIVIYNNTAALFASRHLEKAQSLLSTSMRRLSSGLRVANARDDAAGLAISERMMSQVRGMNQAMRNANDYISMFQQLDYFAGAYVSGLQHIRELAVQALNGTNRASDRLALDRDVQQALQELDRSAAGMTFNGRALADGTSTANVFQAGANAAESISVVANENFQRSALGAVHTLTSSDLRTIGAFSFSNTYTTVPMGTMDFSRVSQSFAGGAFQTSNISLTDYSGAAMNLSVDGNPVVLSTSYGSVTGISNEIQSQLNASNSGEYTVSAVGTAVRITKTASASNAAAAVTLSASGGSNVAEFTAGTSTTGQLASTATKAGFSVDGLAVVLTANHSGDVGGLIADIQSQLDAQTNGVAVYSVSGDASGLSFVKNGEIIAPRLSGFSGTGASVFAQAPAQTLTLGGGDFNVQVGSGPVKAVTGSFASAEALAAAVNATGLDFYASIDPNTGTLEITSNLAITLSGAQASGVLGFGSLTSTSDGSLLNATVRDAKNAAATMQRIDASLTSVSTARSRYGAMQNLIESMIANLRLAAVQTSGARGRIVDADFAVETSHLLRSQILQQAGTAMLAQAQSEPRSVLQLLK